MRSPSGGDPEKHRPLERRAALRTANPPVPPPMSTILAPGAPSTCCTASQTTAVRLAEQGHQVTVVDPSPDALAALGRRAAESDVADRVTGVPDHGGPEGGAAFERAVLLGVPAGGRAHRALWWGEVHVANPRAFIPCSRGCGATACEPPHR